MKTFYNSVIVLGWIGTWGLIALVSTSPLPWWKWILFGLALIATEFGCFASRDKKHEEGKE
jgi:hypothetical protein